MRERGKEGRERGREGGKEGERGGREGGSERADMSSVAMYNPMSAMDDGECRVNLVSLDHMGLYMATLDYPRSDDKNDSRFHTEGGPEILPLATLPPRNLEV